MSETTETTQELNGTEQTEQNNLGSDSEQPTSALDEMEKKLDGMLSGQDSLESKVSQMEAIIKKQNEVIEKQSKDMENLKKVNLELAQHGGNGEQKSVEQLLYEGFKDWR